MQCVAFDSHSQHIAAGDISGRIIIWSDLPAAALRASHGTTVDSRSAGMKVFEPTRWHARALGALCFSHDGAYLLSGGQEGVLVIWQVETFKASFLPRLGGPITHITRCPQDASRYAVAQQDNAVRLVCLAQMDVLTSLYGVRPQADGLPPLDANAGCCWQPGSGYLLLPGRGGSVQLYDLARDRHIERLQVVARNTVTSTDRPGALSLPRLPQPSVCCIYLSTISAGSVLCRCTPHCGADGGAVHAEPAVVRAAFSHDARVLVTIESRPPVDPAATERLHTLNFWDAAAAAGSAGRYDGNTAVSDPHLGPVMALACHPAAAEVVTTGVRRQTGAGHFCIWQRRAARAAPAGAAADARTQWVCRAAGGYKGMPPWPRPCARPPRLLSSPLTVLRCARCLFTRDAVQSCH